MKNFNLYRILMLTMVLAVLGACEDEDANPSPDLNDFIGAYTTVAPSTDPSDGFFNALNDLETEQVAFGLNYDDFEVTDVSNVTVRLQFTEFEGLFDEFRGEFVNLTYPEIDIMTIETADLPVDLTFTGLDMLEILQQLDDKFTSVDSIEVGDFFQLTFPLNLADGTQLTVALNSDLCNEPAQPSFGGCGFGWAVSCPSELIPGGSATYDLSTNVTSTCCGLTLGDQGAGNTATITDLGNGIYEISDILSGHIAPFGIDPEPIRVVDVCANYTLANAASVLSYTGVGSMAEIDEATGVWTITFNNEGNAIAGVATLTPQ